MAWTRVKNRIGTGDLKCGTCPSWLRHWQNGTNQIAAICGVFGCSSGNVVGAHVFKVGALDRATYIVPICTQCNTLPGEFDVLWDLHPTGNSYTCKVR